VGPSVTAAATPSAQWTVHGFVFQDGDADGDWADEEPTLANVEVHIIAPSGAAKRLRTNPDDGSFVFENIPRGPYKVRVQVPDGYRATTDREFDVALPDDLEKTLVFGIVEDPDGLAAEQPPLAETREFFSDDPALWAQPVDAPLAVAPPPRIALDSALTSPSLTALPNLSARPDFGADGADTGEQVMALNRVVSLPLRFAPGRDTLAQVDRRDFGNGLVWLGVPFISQMDGGEFQFVNCGPASLAMVFSAFGLQIGPTEVRDYLNWMIDDYNEDNGTSLDALSTIARKAGLTPIDLYSDRGGYRDWSIDAIRWHVSQGRPVITLVKYRLLPGHGSSVSTFDHYIVISGLTPNGFIYNDGAFATTLGYGLEITDDELERAWTNVSIPHHAVAMTLGEDVTGLSFPERPRATPEPVVAEETVPPPDHDTWSMDPPEAAMASLTGLADLPSAPVVDAPSQDPVASTDSGDEQAAIPVEQAAAVEPPQPIELEPGAEMRRMAPQMALVLLLLWAFSASRSSFGATRRLMAFLGRSTAPRRAAMRTAVVAFFGLVR
jgi:hypothetical protein